MLVSVYLEILLILIQDRCSVFAECTIGSKIIWPHRIEQLGDVGHEESPFGLFRDSVSIGAR
jgi:hypothetical protein